MKFQKPMLQGTILKRYKRFLADIKLDDQEEVVVAHTANTGSMATCWEPGWRVMVSFHDDPKRKLKYSLEMTHNGGTWIGVNTSLPNKLAVEALENGVIKELSHYENIKTEAKVGDSRIDLLLSNGDQPCEKCYVEIKNVTLLGENKLALFPDSVSTRGQKHLRELIGLKKEGYQAAMLYIVQREDVDRFSPAKDIDPTYSQLLKEAEQAGVEILVYQCRLSESGISLSHPLPYQL